MGRPIDLTGQKFGRLTVIERADGYIGRNGKPRRRWLCECDCGERTLATTQDLRKGDKKSCGCLKRELSVSMNTKHGDKGKRLYRIWIAMKRRCANPGNTDYHRYGGRGVSVCDSWRTDYKAFRTWALENGYNDSLTIDRIDVDGNYEPNNCRWVTMKMQSNNRSSNVTYTYNGETHNIREWADIIGVPYSTLYMRLRNGWSVDKALSLHK